MGVKGSKSDITVLATLLVVSLGLNVFLARGWVKAAHPHSSPILALGKVVPPMKLKAMNGHDETIAYAGSAQPTVIYIFTPTCPWCLKNVENVRFLANAKAASFHFVGISLEPAGLGEYVTVHHLAFPTYTDPTPDTRTAYLLGGVPRTIVVSSDGQVLQDWSGAYAFGNEKEVETFFKVHLPGLVEPTAAAGAPS